MATAYDYLKELVADKKCDAWIRLVIEAYVITRGKINEDIKKELVDCLLGRATTTPSVKSTSVTRKNSDTVLLMRLMHIRGVNALANDQTIVFNKDVNIVYGLNGSGKSSYFRMIQTMIGNIEHKELLPNIYSETGGNMEAELTYSLNGTKRKVIWDNTKTIDDLNSIRVFDSSYTSNYLKKRNSDELVLKPYHLDSFAKLVDLIIELKDKAYIEIEEMVDALPQINTDCLNETMIHMLEQERFSDNDEKKIVDSKVIKDEDISQLEQLQHLVDSLQKTSPADKISQLQAEITLCNSATRKISGAINELNRIIKEAKTEIRNYRESLIENERLQQQISVFQSIPGAGTDEWTEFIRKGNAYGIKNELEVCPYCHRPYDDKSLEIIEAYTIFLKDKSTEGLHNAENAITRIENDCKNIIIPVFSELGLAFLGDDAGKISRLLLDAKKVHAAILRAIQNKSIVEMDVCVFTDVHIIDEYVKNALKQIEKLNESEEQRKNSLSDANAKIAILLEQQSIDSQRKTILDYIQKKNIVARLKENVDSKTTNRITSAAKKANQDLLTMQLKDRFEMNLSLMGINDKTIELVGINNKGIQQTELIISSHKRIAEILSEGEQKVCALALFLAEIFVSENDSTIILDDPVNSLDHKMIAAFADVLLQLKNQVIVFTHNRMFLDSIEVSGFGHVCKTLNTACNNSSGKHIYVYEAQSEGKNSKGIIFEKNRENAEFFISESKKLLDKTPFIEKDKTSLYIRKAVELLIDEVIFNNQIPTRYSTKKNHINWNELKKVSGDALVIDDLKSIHKRVSGGRLHNGTESEENPIDKEELREIVVKLETIKNRDT